MDADVALGWTTRLQPAESVRLLETMPPRKAAAPLNRIESGDSEELLNRMRETEHVVITIECGAEEEHGPAGVAG